VAADSFGLAAAGVNDAALCNTNPAHSIFYSWEVPDVLVATRFSSDSRLSTTVGLAEHDIAAFRH